MLLKFSSSYFSTSVLFALCNSNSYCKSGKNTVWDIKKYELGKRNFCKHVKLYSGVTIIISKVFFFRKMVTAMAGIDGLQRRVEFEIFFPTVYIWLQYKHYCYFLAVIVAVLGLCLTRTLKLPFVAVVPRTFSEPN